MNPLRIAVIGAGHLGRIHARIAAALPQIELVAVADPVESARHSVAREASTRAVADYREVLSELDAAIIAAPTALHHKIGCELLACGLPLLIEKPLAPTTTEADELVSLARAMKVVLQVGHVERFNPALGAVTAEVRDPKYIEATRTSGYTFRSMDIGAVLDIMIHDIDVVLALAKSPVVDVEALGVSVLGGHEDMATARLTFASGCVAQLSASRVSFEQQRTMSVFTSRGMVSLDFATHKATIVKPREDVLRRQFRADTLSARERSHYKDHLFDELLVRRDCQPAPVNAIEEEQRDFVHAVRAARAPRVDGQAGRDAVAVANRILERIAEHAWDGLASGRRGPFAMPALPIIAGSTHTTTQERRKAG